LPNFSSKKITSLTVDDSEHVRAAVAKVTTELAPLIGKGATTTYMVPSVLLLLRDVLILLDSVIGVDLLLLSICQQFSISPKMENGGYARQ
jgi:hypothetical protein